MTTREQASQDHALHKEPVPRKHAAKDERGKIEQGVVKDERGQEQPADKKRATRNR
jgi:hypothetical protein